MTNDAMKIYLSGALASANDLSAACKTYDALAKALSEVGHTVYVPHHFTHPKWNACATPAEVYRRDSARLLASDLVIAFLDDASFGVGAEVALAIANHVAVIGLVSQARRVQISRYLEGLIQESGASYIVSYKALNSLLEDVLPILARIPALRSVVPHSSEASPPRGDA